ncbi:MULTISPECIES: hypothetical protein [Methanobacterium]|uniref:Uncharacterized protein n=1 Tax=Methanobacterium veterum TaxID=408577 RepID=A0A9E5A0Q0_9EURY|nr:MULTISPECIES: hypothetical protein [Methanobacterium]MCZ3365601.1 hypothetical protein [Methanobacterium veterum]MCZ3371064.1 hypothetical protein [Methanobacterium veterum]
MDKKVVYINSIFIAVLAGIATLSGLFWKGLYKHETISMAAQAMGQDLITLIIGIPVLMGSLYLIQKNSLKGSLIWMGTLFYFLYSYASMSFLASYNQLFLVYVALFSLSLYTFIYGLLSLNVKTIKESISPGKTSKIAGAFLIFSGAMVALMWVKMIIDSLLTGIAPAALESYTTLVIQALDIGVVFPAMLIAGILIIKGKEWGYALVSILLIKASLMGTALLSMIFFMAQNGVIPATGQVIFFAIITVSGILISISFYSKINNPLYKNGHIKPKNREKAAEL